MTTATRVRLLALTAVLALGATTACGSSDSGSDSTTSTAKKVTGTVDDIPETPADAEGCRTAKEATAETEAPTVTVPADLEAAPFVTDDIPGCGDVVETGDSVTVQYVLKSSTTGEVVDTSWQRGEPFTFTVGEGSVIEGWDIGLVGMRTGGRRTLVLPPEYGYGEQGSPPAIPANDTLVFTIDALDTEGATTTSTEAEAPATTVPVADQVTGTADDVPVTPADAPGCRTEAEASAATQAPTVTVPKDVAAAPFTTDEIPGCGEPIDEGDTISVQYVLKSATTGKVVDSSWDGGAPFTFQVGQGNVIEGWDIGLIGMRGGGRRTLVLPPEYGYGAEGSPPAIPANDTLVFTIDALSAG